MEPMGNMQMPSPQKSNGPVVGIIVVVIVLAIGAYFLFAQLQSQQAARDADTAAQEAQLTDDAAVANIEGDLQAEDLSGLDAGTNADLQQLQTQ